MFVGFFRRDPVAIAFVRNLLLAFFPAVILGLAFGDQIEMLLENAVVVAWALVIGGFGILLVERFAKPRESGGVDALCTRQSILIGTVPCLALIPGVSRTGATLLVAKVPAVDRHTAAALRFLLTTP